VRRPPPERAAVPAPLLVLVAIGSVQTGSAVATGIFDRAGPAGAVLLRLGLGAVVLVAVARPWRLQLSRRTLGAAAVYGVTLAGMNTAFYSALDRLPLGVAVTVEFLGPLTVAMAGSRRALDVLWALLAGSGVLMLSTRGDGDVSLTGLALAALAGAFWASYILASQRVGRLLPGTSGLALALPVGAALVAPLAVPTAGTALLDPSVLAVGAAVALLSTIVPYSLELTALRRMPARVFGVLMSLEPAAAAVAGFLVLGQRLTLPQVAALGLVSAASVGATTTQRTTPSPPVRD
jgi:inner membrane transporter RhtA